ncbi:MAG TPA: 5-formyltetrahydrofolate cyclo-ligase [Clostridiales bacterium]|nr:5-formyltetrahydrofolate cyclo-ligase [Clostridiales bacterium]
MNYANKSSIRKKILDIRENTVKEDIVNNSKIIIKKLVSMESYNKSNVIMCYVNFRNEVITKDFIKESLLNGKRVAVPLIYKEVNKHKDTTDTTDTKSSAGTAGSKKIICCEIKNMDTELEKGVLGILEPKEEYRREIKPEEIDLVVVPGTAFDANKNRMGYGVGYYDNFLKNIREDCITVGVAFDFQVLDEIPVEKHDIALDMIITEKRVIV